MSSATLALTTVARPAANPWLVAVAVVVPAFMVVLDTTIANAALRYIAGGLSAAVVDAQWVLTSYLAANAIILPISGWISARLGRRNYFLLSIAVFTVASGLCGMASSLGQIILFRVIQGLAGGGLQTSSQSVLFDAFPPEKQGTAQTLFAVAALLGPVVGPPLGGYLTVQYDWRWIFYVNLPVGALALAVCYFVVEDPDYLKRERAGLLRRPLNFDYVGLGLLTLVISCWEIMLTKGQEWDWLGDPFWRVQALLGLFAAGLGFLVFREMRIADPVIDFRPLGERNLAASCAIIFCAFAVLYGVGTSLPGLLQSLFAYDAYASGLVQVPSALLAIPALLVAGMLLGRGADARLLIVSGLLVAAAGCWWMSQMNLQISPWQVAWPRVVTICGLAMAFAPLNVAAFQHTPRHLRGAAVGLFALLRNEGGSAGTSMAQTIRERREQFHVARVGEFLDPFNPSVSSFFGQARPTFYQQSGDAVGSQQQALAFLDTLRQQQAESLAYFDVFWAAAVLGLALVFIVLLMKRPVAEEGAGPGAR